MPKYSDALLRKDIQLACNAKNPNNTADQAKYSSNCCYFVGQRKKKYSPHKLNKTEKKLVKNLTGKYYNAFREVTFNFSSLFQPTMLGKQRPNQKGQKKAYSLFSA